MLKYSYLLFTLPILFLIAAVPPTVRATPTLTLVPISVVVANPGTAASYIVSLSGGTANATYALTLTGLPAGASYAFSTQTISEADGSSILTIQTSIPTPLYCPGSYSFTVTATNTLVSSDNAIVTGDLSVNQAGGPMLVVSVSTDKSSYMVGETMTISLGTNRPAEGTLTISPPSGSPIIVHYQYSIPPTKTLTATSSIGLWTVNFAADDYCGYSTSASTQFDVIPGIMTLTSTITGTLTATSTSSTSTTATTEATSTTSVTSTATETGNHTQTDILTGTVSSVQTISSTITAAPVTTTTVMMQVENPTLELILASILLMSVLILMSNLIKRGRRGTITCRNCGFSNPSTAPSFCVKCGRPLRGRSS
jgi:hypothetical protein